MNRFFLFIFSLFLGASLCANVDVTSDYSSFKPGLDVWVKIDIQLEKGAHTYGPNPGEVGLPVAVKWSLPDGVTVTTQKWGKTTSFSYDGIKSDGYEEHADLYFQFHIDETVPPTSLLLEGTVAYLECTDVCIPKKEQFSLTLPFTGGDLNYKSVLDDKVSVSLVVMILSAFLGGIILNIMPCVFPILSLKALHVVSSSSNPDAAKREGVGYTLGILAAFTIFGSLISLLKWSGESVGWGFQLQQPGFVFVLLIVLTMMGLFLQDRLPLPGWMLSLSSSSGQAQYRWSKRSSSFWASVMTGLLAAVVATPCTAPFMATALGFALTQPYWILMTIIWSLGLGLASPFILISFVPSIARCLPKSGPWLSSVKFYLAFPLYVTAVWLLWVFLQQMGVDAVLWVGYLSVLWLVLHSIQTEVWPKGLKRILSIGIVLAMIGSLVSLFSFSPISMTASPFTEDSIYQALDRRQSVFVDVTADWCLTCKVNEHAVLNTKTIQRFFKDNNITVIKADWTRYDENITAYLESFQRSGVPLYVVYQPGKEPVILPQQLTESRVMSAFNL